MIGAGREENDGHKVTFSRIYIMNLDMKYGIPVDAGYIYIEENPAWSPDGSKIALWRGVEMTELAKDGGQRDRKIFQSWKVCVMNSDGTGLTAVDFGDDPAWSNDGKYILHPDPINRDQNRNGRISVKIHLSDGSKNRTLFRTGKDFARMDVGYMNIATKEKK